MPSLLVQVTVAGFVLAAATGTFGTVVIPCDLGDKPLAKLRDANAHIFVARITSITWEDPADGTAIGPLREYSSGIIRGTFRVMAVMKGDPSTAKSLNQTLFGNPSSNPYLRVGTDYLVFTNNFEVVPGHCLSPVRHIQFNGAPDWLERLQRKDPDANSVRWN